MLDVNFDVANQEAQTSFEPLPPGMYTVMLKECELKPTKRGDGQYLQCAHEVHSPEAYKGRLLWDRMNIHNPNSTAQDIGRREYKQLVMALGNPVCTDPEELIGQFMTVKVAIRKSPEYGDSNEIKSRSALESTAPVAAAPAPAPAPTQAPAPAANYGHAQVASAPAPAAPGAAPIWAQQR